MTHLGEIERERESAEQMITMRKQSSPNQRWKEEKKAKADDDEYERNQEAATAGCWLPSKFHSQWRSGHGKKEKKKKASPERNKKSIQQSSYESYLTFLYCRDFRAGLSDSMPFKGELALERGSTRWVGWGLLLGYCHIEKEKGSPSLAWDR